MQEGIGEKEERLRRIAKQMGSVVVSFSGGADSSLVLAVSVKELGERAIGVMGVSPSIARIDLENARAAAAAMGARFEEVETEEFGDAAYLANGEDRCFHCKALLLRKMGKVAEREGFAFIADGFNADDVLESRPGQEAARRAGIRSPLAEAGLSKPEIRELLKKMGFAFWDRPSNPCLSTRVAAGIRLEPALLKRIEEAEIRVRSAVPGVRNLRVRHTVSRALVEADPEFIPAVRRAWAEISASLRELGWPEAGLDERGYRRGAMSGAASREDRDDIPR